MEHGKNCCVRHIHAYSAAHTIAIDERKEEKKDSREKRSKVKEV